MVKTVRTICLFFNRPDDVDSLRESIARLRALGKLMEADGWVVQTLRVCCTRRCWPLVREWSGDEDVLFSVGSMNLTECMSDDLASTPARLCFLDEWLACARSAYFNLDVSRDEPGSLGEQHLAVFRRVAREKPALCFNFSYACLPSPLSPYFPGTTNPGRHDVFSVGLQPTDLFPPPALGLDSWCSAMHAAWLDVNRLFAQEPGYLGVDSSLAPLGSSSVLDCVRRASGRPEAALADLVVSDVFTRLTSFIKNRNPRPVGQCGLMTPLCEDDALCREYEAGQFTLERNLFLSLHCGLGIDTYPVPALVDGPDSKRNEGKILDALRLLHALSLRYRKTLYARFVTDGRRVAGQKSDFQNPHLVDVMLRNL